MRRVMVPDIFRVSMKVDQNCAPWTATIQAWDWHHTMGLGLRAWDQKRGPGTRTGSVAPGPWVWGPI